MCYILNSLFSAVLFCFAGKLAHTHTHGDDGDDARALMANFDGILGGLQVELFESFSRTRVSSGESWFVAVERCLNENYTQNCRNFYVWKIFETGNFAMF